MPIFLSDIPSLFASRPRPARRGAAAALAAGRARLLHARHVGRRGAGGRRVARRSSSRKSTTGCRARTATRSCRSSRVNAFIHTIAAAARAPAGDARGRSRTRSASTWPRSSTTARRCRWGSARSPTPCSRASATSTTSASTPRCSPTASSTSSKPASSPTGARACIRGRIVTSFVAGTQRALRLRGRQPVRRVPPVRPHERHARSSAQNDKVRRHQLGARDRPHPARSCADSIGYRIYSRHRRADGLHPRRRALRGRQADHRAAVDGRERHGQSRIVPSLKPGAGVVTTRGHVHWVVTEHGAVNLFGRSLRERAELLIGIAHPDVRGDLRRALAETRHIDLGA